MSDEEFLLLFLHVQRAENGLQSRSYRLDRYGNRDTTTWFESGAQTSAFALVLLLLLRLKQQAKTPFSSSSFRRSVYRLTSAYMPMTAPRPIPSATTPQTPSTAESKLHFATVVAAEGAILASSKI